MSFYYRHLLTSFLRPSFRYLLIKGFVVAVSVLILVLAFATPTISNAWMLLMDRVIFVLLVLMTFEGAGDYSSVSDWKQFLMICAASYIAFATWATRALITLTERCALQDSFFMSSTTCQVPHVL